MLSLFSDPQILVGLFTLIILEIVLGIDNIIFISLIVSGLPKKQAEAARKLGLFLALLFRVLLLLGISWVIGLKATVVSAFGLNFSWKDIILIAGGLFLLFKATQEIHKMIEGAGEQQKTNPVSSTFSYVIFQIVLIDMIFSLDAIITAIGVVEHVEVMIVAVVVSMFVMYFASVSISHFIEKHPTTKMLALSFLFLIGVALTADGLHFHIPRGYIYFAIAFSLCVETFNILAKRRKRSKE